MRKLLLLITVFAIIMSAGAQLKIVGAGDVGIGTNNPAQKLHVLGKAALMDNVGIGTDNPTQKLHVLGKAALMDNVGIGTATPMQKLHVVGNTIISGNLGLGINNPEHRLDILYGTVRFSLWGGDSYGVIFNGGNGWGAPQIINKYNRLLLGNEQYPVNALYVKAIYYESLYESSDARLKENIKPLGSTLNKLMEVEGKSYNYKKSEKSGGIPDFEKISERETFGFLAQDLEKVFPELVLAPNPTNSYYSVDYLGMIPILVEAVKEQQKLIEQLHKSGEPVKKASTNDEWQQEVETLKQEVEALKEALSLCCNAHYLESTEEDNIHNTPSLNLSEPVESGIEEMILYQNTPNPFYETTSIQCYIPETIRKVELCVYNVQGVRVKCINIIERGLAHVQIEAGQLSAGVYTYLLIGDGKAGNAKKMVLTR